MVLFQMMIKMIFTSTILLLSFSSFFKAHECGMRNNTSLNITNKTGMFLKVSSCIPVWLFDN